VFVCFVETSDAGKIINADLWRGCTQRGVRGPQTGQGFAQLLRADESKAATSADVMRIRRMMAAAEEDGGGYDAMLSEPTTNNLFACGALYFSKPGA
jgi:hypothetical protein